MKINILHFIFIGYEILCMIHCGSRKCNMFEYNYRTFHQKHIKYLTHFSRSFQFTTLKFSSQWKRKTKLPEFICLYSFTYNNPLSLSITEKRRSRRNVIWIIVIKEGFLQSLEHYVVLNIMLWQIIGEFPCVNTALCMYRHLFKAFGTQGVIPKQCSLVYHKANNVST